MRPIARTGALVAGALLVALQLVPYGRDHANPPVVQDAPWSSAEARRLAVAACYDCHSNETVWPVYSLVAPASWLIQHDVEEGRQKLNFSVWGTAGNEVDELAEVVQEGSMPPRNYKLLHPGARLSAAEKAALIQELESMAGTDRSGSDRGRG